MKYYTIFSTILLLLLLISIDSKERKISQLENEISKQDLSSPIDIELKLHYKIYPEDGINRKVYKNVGATYYTRGEVTVPSTTMRSGRYVFDGAVAVSQDLWGNVVMPGDVLYVKKTNKWYIVEDTMHKKYKKRIDIYTHSMEEANSGSFRTDILIVRVKKNGK